MLNINQMTTTATKKKTIKHKRKLFKRQEQDISSAIQVQLYSEIIGELLTEKILITLKDSKEFGP